VMVTYERLQNALGWVLRLRRREHCWVPGTIPRRRNALQVRLTVGRSVVVAVGRARCTGLREERWQVLRLPPPFGGVQ